MFFLVVKLLYNFKYPSVWNVFGKICDFSQLLFTIMSEIFCGRFLLPMKIYSISILSVGNSFATRELICLNIKFKISMVLLLRWINILKATSCWKYFDVFANLKFGLLHTDFSNSVKIEVVKTRGVLREVRSWCTP